MLALDLALPAPVDAPYAVVHAIFLPADARKRFGAAARDLRARVVVELPALPDGTSLRVDYSGGHAAHALLQREGGKPAA